MSAGTSRMWSDVQAADDAVPGNSPPNRKKEMYVPITGMDLMTPSMMRRPLPESRSSGSE